MTKPPIDLRLGPSRYHDADHVRRRIALGEHRDVIGGMWDELGALQRDFLIEEGLQPHHRLIDIGCGSLRAGVPLTEYLNAERYYGIDISADLLDAGYDREIVPAGLADKLPRRHLHATASYDVSGFGAAFDFGLAQSVFTHLPLDELSACLAAIAPHFVAGGRYYVTYFERPADADPAAPLPHDPGGVISHPDKDPFDATVAALAGATPASWRLDIIGRWGHPRDQRMARFVRAD
jgi:hypothetical protein